MTHGQRGAKGGLVVEAFSPWEALTIPGGGHGCR